jgi:hypothetical protein
MLIAQHLVAGEGDDRPQLSGVDSAVLDHEALENFVCDRSNLPWIVFRAAHRANHIAAIPSRSRALLAALARTVDAHRPYAAIFARRELLTGRALQSMRTFYRSLDDLAAAGLVVRAPQKRYGDAGLFGRAYIHLTEKTAMLLGFVEEAKPAASDEEPSTVATNSPESTSLSIDDLSLDRPSATLADGAIYKDLFPKNQKRQPGTLPQDLKRLLALGFHEFLIFKLMREAKQHGKLLSDVVEATWNHLSIAKRPISYVRSLLRSPVDFGQQLRAREIKIQEKRYVAAKVRAVEEIAQRHAGEVFYDEGTTRRFEISIDATEITIRDCREPRARISTSGWKADFVTALTAKHLVRSCPELDTAFREKSEGVSYVASNRSFAISPQVETGHAWPKPTEAISNRLRDMKRLLRAACAGANRDREGQGDRPIQPKTA